MFKGTKVFNLLLATVTLSMSLFMGVPVSAATVTATTFADLVTKVNAAEAAGGGIVYVQGVLTCNAQLLLDSINTSKVQIIGNTGAGLNFKSFKDSIATKKSSDSYVGVRITGSNYSISNLTIKNAPDNGIQIKGSNAASNIITNCSTCYNLDGGLQITSGAHDNQVINCDSFYNFDNYLDDGQGTYGSNADGFSCKLLPGANNSFTGCRAYNNSDDGWDLYSSNYTVKITNCWTWHNGDSSFFSTANKSLYPDLEVYTASAWGGNGCGFKLGGGSNTGAHVVTNCIAFDNHYGKTGNNIKGFDNNSNTGLITLLNCSGWNNQYNWWFDDGSAKITKGYSYSPTVAETKFNSSVTVDSTSKLGTADSSYFNSTSVTNALAARQSDGSLPTGFGTRVK